MSKSAKVVLGSKLFLERDVGSQGLTHVAVLYFGFSQMSGCTISAIRSGPMPGSLAPTLSSYAIS